MMTKISIRTHGNLSRGQTTYYSIFINKVKEHGKTWDITFSKVTVLDEAGKSDMYLFRSHFLCFNSPSHDSSGKMSFEKLPCLCSSDFSSKLYKFFEKLPCLSSSDFSYKLYKFFAFKNWAARFFMWIFFYLFLFFNHATQKDIYRYKIVQQYRVIQTKTNAYNTLDNHIYVSSDHWWYEIIKSSV